MYVVIIILLQYYRSDVYSLDESDIEKLLESYILKIAAKLLSASDHTIQVYVVYIHTYIHTSNMHTYIHL
jgi:hypothetical protein